MAANNNMTTYEKNVEKFKDLVQSSTDDQMEFFLKSFIFDLGDSWKDVVSLQKTFQNYLSHLGEHDRELNAWQAADFLQKNGLERTALQRKEEIRDVDLDNNDRLAFIEYLLLHYKEMILRAYMKRTETAMDVDLSKKGVGVTGVGKELLEELMTLPVGLPQELVDAIEEFTAKKKAREAKEKELKAKAEAGGVKGLAAKNELEQLKCQDVTEMNKVEITLNAAKRRAAKQNGDVELQKKKQKEEDEKKKKLEESRNRLKAKMAMFQRPEPTEPVSKPHHARRNSATAA